MINPLTKKQAAVLLFILRYKRDNGYLPSYAEIARHFKITLRAIEDRIYGIAKKGFIRLHEGDKVKRRALEITNRAMIDNELYIIVYSGMGF